MRRHAGQVSRPGTMTLSSVSPDWLPALRRYLAVMVVGNLTWETAQLPLYTIWRTGTLGEKAFAVLHCTGGDLLIGLTALTVALVLAADSDWPGRGFARTAGLSVMLGVGYTTFSEWLNIVVRAAWQYSDAMPVIPLFGFEVGASPLAQWIVVPSLALWSARRQTRRSGPN